MSRDDASQKRIELARHFGAAGPDCEPLPCGPGGRKIVFPVRVGSGLRHNDEAIRDNNPAKDPMPSDGPNDESGSNRSSPSNDASRPASE